MEDKRSMLEADEVVLNSAYGKFAIKICNSDIIIMNGNAYVLNSKGICEFLCIADTIQTFEESSDIVIGETVYRKNRYGDYQKAEIVQFLHGPDATLLILEKEVYLKTEKGFVLAQMEIFGFYDFGVIAKVCTKETTFLIQVRGSLIGLGFLKKVISDELIYVKDDLQYKLFQIAPGFKLLLSSSNELEYKLEDLEITVSYELEEDGPRDKGDYGRPMGQVIYKKNKDGIYE